MRREIDDQWGAALTLSSRGEALLAKGDLVQATASIEKSLAIFTALGAKEHIAMALCNLGSIVREQGDFGRALQLYRESSALAREMKANVVIVGGLDGMAEIAHAQGRAAPAIHLFALATELRERYEIPRATGDEARCVSKIAALRASLGEEVFAREWAWGPVMSVDEAASM
jgi:tetratricopeptide (TPR) repeat protein